MIYTAGQVSWQTGFRCRKKKILKKKKKEKTKQTNYMGFLFIHFPNTALTITNA